MSRPRARHRSNAGSDVRVDLPAQLAALVAVLPDQPLQRFQARRFPVAIHQPADVLRERRGGLKACARRSSRCSAQGARASSARRTISFALQVCGRVRARVGKQNRVDELDRRRRPLDIEDNRPRLKGRQADGHIARSRDPLPRTNDGPKQSGWKLASTPLFGVVRRPAGLILKQPDGADPPVGAEIEPVMRAARDADQVAGLRPRWRKPAARAD